MKSQFTSEILHNNFDEFDENTYNGVQNRLYLADCGIAGHPQYFIAAEPTADQ
jgi:hypothetical protein